MPDLTYAQAANAALDRALSEIPETLLFGEDVALPGGVFGVTKGLAKAHGDDRVFDTPISESAIIGGALGAALMGRRPIIEVMWIDFTLVALDQIVNQLANVRYVSQGRLSAPVTIRTQQGSMPGACAQHSQSLEAFFAHVPGLIVGMPATAQDAHDMLLSAVYSDDPSLVIENRTMYHGAKVDVRTDGDVAPIGGAVVRRPGEDVTVVSWGATMHRAVEAAGRQADTGTDVELIDLRWMRPLDMDTILASARRTGRLVVAHEAHTFAGLGAEIVASVIEAGVDLSAPPVRIGTPPVRIPAAPTLLEAVVPSVDGIDAAIAQVMSPSGRSGVLDAATSGGTL